MADQRLTTRGLSSNIDDLDVFHQVDVSDITSHATGTSKKLTWSLIKTTLTTFFNTLYQLKGNYVTTDTVQQINEDKGYNRSDVQIDSLGDLSLVNKRYVLEKILGGGTNGFVTTNTNQLTGLTGNKTWDGEHEFKKIITSSVVPAADFDVPNKIYVDDLVSATSPVSQSNLSFGESYIDNYRDRVLDDGATYFPNQGGYNYALVKEQGIQNDMSFFFTPSAVKTDVLYNVKGDNFTVVRNGTADYIDEDGVTKTAVADVARIDYSSGDAVLLTAIGATNLVLRSEEFDNSYWTKQSITITANNIISPDGELTGDKLLATNAGGRFFVNENLPAGTYTMSMHVKNIDATVCAFIAFGSGVGTLAEKDIINEISISEWTRVSLTFTHNLEGGNVQILFVNGLPLNESLYFWAAQLELSSVASSNIKTEASTVTRSADLITNGGSVDDFNSVSGSFVVNIQASSDDLSTRTISINDGTDQNSITIGYNGTSNTILAEYLIGGAASASLTHAVSDITELHLVEFQYAENDFKLLVDEVEQATDISGSVLSADTLDSLDFHDGGGSNNFIGGTSIIKCFK